MTTTDTIDVCVIVPTYNRAGYLAESLRSLLDQSVAARQILVVDDGSTDHTRDVVAGFGPRVTYLHQANAGKPAALNHALRVTSAELVWIFDDDDLADPDALRLLSDALLADPGAGFAFGDNDRFAGTLDQRTPALTQPFDPDTFHVHQAMQMTVFQGAMLVRRRCYEEVGPFDEALARAEDYAMMLRLAARYRAVRVDRVLFHQRQHTGDRGPAHLRIDGTEVWDRQVEFDAMVLTELHDRGELRLFLPKSENTGDLTPERTSRALLARAGAMSRKQLWALAGQDIAEAIGIADRAGIARLPEVDVKMLTGGYWGGKHVRGNTATPPVLEVLRAHRASPLGGQLLGELSWTYFGRIGRDVFRRRWKPAKRHAADYLRTTGGASILRHIARAARRGVKR